MKPYTLNHFSDETILGLAYYVYRLIDPRNGETFYVGKGKGNRVFEHLKCALKIDENEDEISAKYAQIHAIQNAGLTVLHLIHRHGMDEKTAEAVEAALIDAYPGLTNIQNGKGSNGFGVANAWEIEQLYRLETAELDNHAHKLIVINVNNTFETNELYDAVRFAWSLNVNRARSADYVLAVTRGKIVGVFQADEWKEATIENFPEFKRNRPGRFGFTGRQLNINQDEDKAICSLYLNKRLPESYRKKGASNPVKYNQACKAE